MVHKHYRFSIWILILMESYKGNKGKFRINEIMKQNQYHNLHERVLKLVYQQRHTTFEGLLIRDKSASTHHKKLQMLAIEMRKV